MSSYRPDRATFEDLVDRHPIVPVWREVLADSQTPVAAFKRLAFEPDSFLLESVEGGERWARHIVHRRRCIRPSAGARWAGDGGRGSSRHAGARRAAAGVRPEAVGVLQGARARGLGSAPAARRGRGFLGYDCVRELERLPGSPPDDLGLPDLALLLTRTFVVFDHLAQKAFVITNVSRPADPRRAYDDAVDRCEAVVERLAAPLEASPIELSDDLRVRFDPDVDDEEYARWVGVVKEHVHAGDIFQAVPSRRFVAPLGGSSFNAYRVLRTLNPSPYMYFLRFGASERNPEYEIAGSSPEPLVRVTGDKIVTRPIAGTRPRGATEQEDAAFARDLIGDEKERAEHVMLVDLARNDVGRVARYGSVQVDELMQIERYSHVMHIVSNVTGSLREGATAFDALTACFPAGTVSGAPKVRAMEIIDSLEKTKRGPYAGVVGYFDFSGNLDTCITIRTIVATGDRVYVQAGAGVVADSVPASEADETRRKAEVLFRAVAGATALEDRGQPS